MKYFIFDIETNGLTLEQVTKIHCLSFLEVGVPGAKVRTITDYGQMKRFFTQKDVCIIGHNIWAYDIPTAEYILDFEIDPTTIRVVDTLALSWYLFEDRPKHGLEQWGEDLGIKKVEVKDWNTDDIKLYTFRCEEDVKITKLLLDACNKKLKDLYGASTKRAEVADYLSFKMYCYYIAQKHPLKLDIEKVDATLELIENKLEETKLALESQMPLVPAYATKSKPKNCYKKDGNLSKHGEAWFDLLKSSGLPEDHEEDVKYIKGYDPPSYTSSQQVKEWLFSLGWEPTEFKQGANGDVPQVRIEDEDGAKILAPCVRKLIKIAPQIEYLEELGVLAHRKGILKGFLSSVDSQGYIRADIGGLTTTLRVKHRTLVNLPGVKRAWGADVRGCLIAPEGYELAGSDVSGLEDTTKRHYIYPYDEEYVKEQMAPGFDAHCDIAIRAKLMTEADVQFYKAFKKVSGSIEAGQTPDPELVNIVTSFCPEEEKQYKLFQKLDAQRFKGKTTNFCLPVDNTTILTPNGWKSYDELSLGDEIFSLNTDTDELEITHIESIPYFEDAECISLHNNYWAYECTPNHRWWVERERWRDKETKKWNYPKSLFRDAKDIKTSDHIVIAKKYQDGEGIGINNARILGWLLSDGYVAWSKLGPGTSDSFGKKRGVRASISQKKYWEALEEDIKTLKYKKYDRWDGVNIYEIDPTCFRDWWRGLGLPDKDKKEIDYIYLIFKMTPEERLNFLDAFKLADGGFHSGNDIYYQNRGGISEAVMLALTLSGRYFNTSSNGFYKGRENINITVRNRSHVTGQVLKKTPTRKTNVFCVNNKNQTFIARQGDHITITGNSSTYKVGAKKLGATLDISKREAQKILDAFWKRNWAITAFEKDLVVKSIESPQKVVKEQVNSENKKEKVSYFVNKSEDWVLNPMNGFWYKLRSQKDKFSAINQSTGAFCFDMWMKNIIFEYKKVAAQFHDELIAIIPQGHRQGFRTFLTKHMDKVNEDYQLNTPLRVDVNFGFNYADVH